MSQTKNCPHDGASRVLQTRKLDGMIYRERVCERCDCRYFTVENRIPKMPSGLQAHRKKPGRMPTWAEIGFPVKHGRITKSAHGAPLQAQS